MLSLDDLRFFQTVAASRSLGSAARTLEVTAPGVSRKTGVDLTVYIGRDLERLTAPDL
jgi:hypothetical protein